MAATSVGDPSATARRIASFDSGVDGFFERYLRGRPGLDRVFYAASAVGDHGVIWLVLAAVRGLRAKDDTYAVIRAAGGVGIESALVNGPVKALFRRARPVYEGLRPRPLRRPRTSSFPSGHATSAFCAARLLSDGDPALRPLYYGLAILVAWSRVYVRIHHASDVVGGMAIGAALGEVGRRVYPLPPPARSAVEARTALFRSAGTARLSR
jgi:membrane-associated phospholipid phosphatase